MVRLAQALTAVAAVCFVLAAVFTLVDNFYFTTPEGYSRAATNLTLLAIALVLCFGPREAR